MSRICFVVVCLTIVLPLACALVAPKYHRKPPATASTRFTQFNSSLYLFGGSAPTASWGILPFSSTVKQIVYEGRFFLLLLNDGSVFKATPQGMANGGTDAFEGPIGSLDASCRLVIGSSPPFDPDVHVLAACATNAGLCVVNNYVSPASLKCKWWPYNVKASGVIVDAAIQYLQSSSLLMVATSNGLFAHSFADNKTVQVLLTNTTGKLRTDSNVTSVFCLPYNATTASAKSDSAPFQGGKCFAASAENFCDRNICPADLVHAVSGTVEVYFDRVPGIIDARPTGAVFDATRRAIHFGNSQCINQMFENGTLHRVDGRRGGLPQRNLTCGAAAGGLAFFGSSAGGIVMLRPDGTWKYFYGSRWLPSRSFDATMGVTSIAGAVIDGNEAVLAATPTGLTFIHAIQWTLEEKASHFQSMIYPRHDRFGLCAGVSLRKFGDLSSYEKHDNDNDGLWTSMYLASQSLRYAATADPEARANAWRAFTGMLNLTKATGVRGLPARSILFTDTPPSYRWQHSKTMPGFLWKDDTSSDEITGHLGVYPLFHDLVAQTPSEKAQAAKIIDDITGYITDNNFTLVDVFGNTTTWGHWDPQSLNNSPFWFDERGLNALQILSFLSNAYRITGNAKYLTAFNSLVDDHHYADNMINAKITFPEDINYSDDELTFLPYFGFLWSRQMPNGDVNPCYKKVEAKLWLSVQRTEQFVKRYKPSLWNLIYAAYARMYAPGDVQRSVNDATWCLETWPISFVDWPTNNANRLDVLYAPFDPNSRDPQIMETLLPYDEISLLRLNGDPFRSLQGSGFGEDDMAAWLYPYWLGRYLKLIPPQ